MPDENKTGVSRFFKKKPDWVVNKTAGVEPLNVESHTSHNVTIPPLVPASPSAPLVSPTCASPGRDDHATGGIDLFRRGRDTQKFIADREKKNAEKELKRKKKREREELRKKQEEEEAKKRMEEEQEQLAIQSVEQDATPIREVKRRRISDENEDYEDEKDRMKERYTSEDSLYAATPRAFNRTVPLGGATATVATGRSPTILHADDDGDLVVTDSRQLTPSPSQTVSPPTTKAQSQPGTQENAIHLDLEPDITSLDVNNHDHYDLETLPTPNDDYDYDYNDYSTIAALPTTSEAFPSSIGHVDSKDYGPPIQIFISSNLPPGYPPVTPLIITRRYKQALGRVREHWCKYNKIVDPYQVDSIFLTWKGEKVFDVATLEILGVQYEVLNSIEEDEETESERIEGRSSDNVRIRVLNGGDEDEVEAVDGTSMKRVKGMLGDERVGGVHLVATTAEMEEKRKKAEEEKARQRVLRDNTAQIGDDMSMPNMASEEELQGPTTATRKFRVILRSKDFPPMKLLLRPTTVFATVVERFRKSNQLGPDVSIKLRYDDEELLPEQTVADTEIAEEAAEENEVVTIDVHIK